MRVKDAIEYLSRLPSDDHIVIAWWEMEMFFPIDYDHFAPQVSKEEWESVAEVGDDIDWSETHGDIRFAIEEAILEDRKAENE